MRRPRRNRSSGNRAAGSSKSYPKYGQRSPPGNSDNVLVGLVQLEAGTPVPQAQAAAVDANALRRELETAIEGEVRFDLISRALYSTDARVHQVQALGLVVACSRQDTLRG